MWPPASRTDLNQTFEILKKLTGYSGEVKYGPERAGDVKHSLADISRAQKHLGYKPTEISRKVLPNDRMVPPA